MAYWAHQSLASCCASFVLSSINKEITQLVLDKDNNTRENSEIIIKKCRQIIDNNFGVSSEEGFIPHGCVSTVVDLARAAAPSMRLIITTILDPSPRTLKLEGTEPISRSLVAALVAGLQDGVCEIETSRYCMSDDILSTLSFSMASKSLTRIDCASGALTDASAFAWSRLANLVDISLRGNEFITLETLDAICALPQLRKIDFDCELVPKYSILSSILRSSTVREIRISLDDDDIASVEKFWDLLRGWEGRETLERFDTGCTRLNLVSEGDVREFKLICPRSTLVGLVCADTTLARRKEEAVGVGQTPGRKSTQSVFTMLQEEISLSRIIHRASIAEDFPSVVPISLNLQQLIVRVPGFSSPGDRHNFLASLLYAKRMKVLRLFFSNEEEKLTASETALLLGELPDLTGFSVSLRSEVKEISFSHSNLASFPIVEPKEVRVEILWLPRLTSFRCTGGNELPVASALPNLTRIDIERGSKVKSDILDPYMGRLVSLSVQPGLRNWPSSAPSFCKLQTIRIYLITMDHVSLKRMMESCPLLTELDLTHGPSYPDESTAETPWILPDLRWLKHKLVKFLSISGCIISQDNYSLELSGETLPSLRMFHLESAQGITNTYVHDLPELSRLSFQKNIAPGQRFRIQRNPELSWVSLFQPGDYPLSEFILEDNPNLITLVDYGNKIHEAEQCGLAVLQPLRSYIVPTIE